MTDDRTEEPKSRSQAKREHLALKDLGKTLAGLSERQLLCLPLSEDTRAAVLTTKRLSRGALQRHYRYLASLLTQEDVAGIRVALAGGPHRRG